MTTLVQKVVAIANSLENATIPFAFGGALALAYATEEPRGTRDIDVNVFVTADAVGLVFAALPAAVAWSGDDRAAVGRDEQVRLWWDDTPIDLFFAASDLHRGAGERRRTVPFAEISIPVLAPEDLAVFGALFDRSKDWVDIETMLESGTIDAVAVADVVAGLLGEDDRVDRLRRMRR